MSLCASLAVALAIIGCGAAIIGLCNGHLIYSLDDPYISLALSQHLAHSHYGINANEASSPASSIFFPLILAAFAWARWQEWVPAILNALAACLTSALIATQLCRLGIVTRGAQVIRGAALTVAICIAMNAVGLVFIGLEHSLHLLTSILVVVGVARVLETQKPAPWLIGAIVLLPLLRFEGLALAAASILTLVVAGERRAGLAAAIAIALTLGAFMATMSALGLPLLPSSVLIKSQLARQAVEGSFGLHSLWHELLGRAAASLENPEAWPVLVLLLLVMAHPLLRMYRVASRSGSYSLTLRREALLAAMIGSALVAHILVGAWGSFGRYEAYVVAIGATGSLILWRKQLAGLIGASNTWKFAALISAVLSVGIFYVIDTVQTPLASLGIYEQQYQMHRFAADFYKQPVGVNDIGWVSYRNPNYVLDLAGLGSESARRARTAASVDPDWMEKLVDATRYERRPVGLVMIYEEWFPGEIPSKWRRVATLRSTHLVTASHDTVTFYATSQDAVGQALEALTAFRGSTGPGTTVNIISHVK